MGAVYSAGLNGKFEALESIISETRRRFTNDAVSIWRYHEPAQ